MAQGVSFLAMKQLTWILLCWAIISPRFEKRKKKVSLRQNLFDQQRRGKQKKTKNVCHLQLPLLLGDLWPSCYLLTNFKCKTIQNYRRKHKTKLTWAWVWSCRPQAFISNTSHENPQKRGKNSKLYKTENCTGEITYPESQKPGQKWRKNICKLHMW